MKIWELSIAENNFTSFYLPEENKLEELGNVLDKIRNNEFSFKEWKPTVLLKQEQRIDPDFLDVADLGAIIISSKAKEMLETIYPAKEEYDLYPLLNDEDSYYLFNLRTSIDCLEKEHSTFNALPSGQILTYEGLVFDSEQVEEKPIFRIPELPYTLFITHAFHYYYEEARLKGIDFDQENVVFTD